MRASVIDVLANGCPCCGRDVAFGELATRQASPSIDRVVASSPYSSSSGPNWDIICWTCNMRKNSASIEIRSRIIAALGTISANLDATLESASSGNLVAKRQRKDYHDRKTCSECATLVWCTACSTHNPASDSNHHQCKRCSSVIAKECRRRKAAGITPAPHGSKHVCTAACETPNLPFCYTPEHNAHVPVDHINGNSRKCYTCSRSYDLYHGALRRAQERQTPFDSTPEFHSSLLNDIFTRTACVYCSRQFRQCFTSVGVVSPLSKSLDCIIPKYGYVHQNVACCCMECNSSKGDMTLDDLRALNEYCMWRASHPIGHENGSVPPKWHAHS